jgi:hypothetical protein
MRLLTFTFLRLALRRFWGRRPADEYAALVAAVGLSRAEEEAFLSLRGRR